LRDASEHASFSSVCDDVCALIEKYVEEPRAAIYSVDGIRSFSVTTTALYENAPVTTSVILSRTGDELSGVYDACEDLLLNIESNQGRRLERDGVVVSDWKGSHGAILGERGQFIWNGGSLKRSGHASIPIPEWPMDVRFDRVLSKEKSKSQGLVLTLGDFGETTPLFTALSFTNGGAFQDTFLLDRTSGVLTGWEDSNPARQLFTFDFREAKMTWVGPNKRLLRRSGSRIGAMHRTDHDAVEFQELDPRTMTHRPVGRCAPMPPRLATLFDARIYLG
jgi:hypothetical protein